MKRIFACNILALILISIMLTACSQNGSTPTTKATSEGSNIPKTENKTEAPSLEKSNNLKDIDFIVNVSKGLESRWKITDNDAEWDSKTHTSEEVQNHYKTVVESELDTIGELSQYTFENKALETLAIEYVSALQQQYEAAGLFTSTESSNEEWETGYARRVLCLSEFFKNYGATVNDKYKDVVIEMTDQELPNAKKYIAIQGWLNDLKSVEFKLDEEESNDYIKYYKGLIENTSGYPINSLSIHVDLLDEAGVVVEQYTDYLNNLTSGQKYYAKFSTSKKISSWNITYQATYY